MQDALVGTEVEGYRIHEVLGRGGMGVVYRAEDLSLSRTVALKCINRSLGRDERFLRRFRSEAQALAQVESPYIVQIHTLSRLEIGRVIVMEYVEGENLEQRIGETGLAWRQARPYVRQMLTALRHAHGADVVHRDVKPQNVLLADTPTRHGNRLKMTDFGLAKMTASPGRTRTVTEGVYGSLPYMSPEQVEGSGGVDHRSDLYSLGMTTYRMLAGRLPFEEETTYRIMRTIVEGEVPSLRQYAADVPVPVREFVMKSLETNPDDRFQHAEEMQAALPEATPTTPDPRSPAASTEAPPTVVEPASRPESPGADTGSATPLEWGAPAVPWERGALAATAILVVGLLVGGGYYVSQAGEGESGRDTPAKGRSTAARAAPTEALPPSLTPLARIDEAEALRATLAERVEAGDVIRGRGPEDFFIPARRCYVIVLDEAAGRVEAVLDTGRVRHDLRSGTPVPDWKDRYAGHTHVWVAPTR
jgi:serine/threonine-protein kinase